MKTMLVYGCPCSGKSTYVREHAGENDAIWDFDKLINAATTRQDHTAERHVIHWSMNNLRHSFIDEMCANGDIDTLWILCHWPTERILQDCEPCVDMEMLFITATREECYERLENDLERPDKEAWREIIDRWFAEHDTDQPTDNAANAAKKGTKNMTFNEYTTQRLALLNDAKSLIDAGRLDDADAKIKNVEALDEQWDAICTAQANARALEGTARMQNVSNPGALPVPGTIESTLEGTNSVKPEDLYKTDVYKVAWAKTMMGAPLTAEEANTFRMANEYTHTTENSGVVIPETVALGIWSEVEDLYPYFADVTKTYVNGILTIIQSDTSSEAAWYDEDTATEDGKELFKSYQLTGCELSRAITVSWKLKEMAMDDFIPYIQRRMAERMGKALGYGVTNGKGKPGTGDTFKPEPLGTVTALVADAAKRDDGGQVVTYTQGAMAYSDVTAARALIKSGYANGLAVYANANTIWTGLANVKDDNGRPIFVADPSEGGVYKVLGVTVKEDASMADGDVLFSNAHAGYQANINKQIGVVTEDHAKPRTTDYCGYAIVDGAPLTMYAHALLTPAAKADAGTGE